MKRIGLLLILILLTACVTVAPRQDARNQAGGGHVSHQVPPGRSRQPAEPDKVGRIGPGGAVPVADRGIGGTGAPVALATAIQTAERGIGGTGIVGVVTGFGSVFVNGIEVEYDDAASVDIDGAASSLSSLRAGQLVAIQADGSAGSPRAKAIAVRSAAVGRIEALELGSGMLTIAGQAVSVPEGTWGADHFGLGDWVRVSGLRRDDGTIVASRLDAASPGVLLARGQVVRDNEGARVGHLILTGPTAATVKDGQFVVVAGDYASGHGQISTVAPDTLVASPVDYFGPSINQLVVQAFVRIDKGFIFINGVKTKSQSLGTGQIRQDGLAVVSLQRRPDGSFTAVEWHYGDYQGHTEQPAPTGSGAEAAQASQRGRHTAAPTPLPSFTAEDASAANESPTTAAMAGDPYPISGPTSVARLIAPATNMSVPLAIHGGPLSGDVATPLVIQTEIKTIPQAGSTMAASSASLDATATNTASSNGSASSTVGQGALPPPVQVTSPPQPELPTQPEPSIPTVQRVAPSPGQPSGGNTGNATMASAIWAKPRLPTVLSPHQHPRSGLVAVKGSASSPTISLLTGAMTSGTPSSGGTTLLTTPSAANAASIKAVSRSGATIGTRAVRSAAGRSR